MGVHNHGFFGGAGDSKLYGAMGEVSPTLSQREEFSRLAAAVERGVPDPHSLGWGL